MNDFCLIVGMMAVTFAVRYGLLGLGGQLHLSSTFKHLMRYIPPAMLTAIVVPTVLIPINNEQIHTRLVGAIVAVLVSYKTQNVLLTIGLGMLTFLIF